LEIAIAAKEKELNGCGKLQCRKDGVQKRLPQQLLGSAEQRLVQRGYRRISRGQL
jgi:hypothetical protein